jgi:uncharacterized protein (DUF488 family)
MEKYLTKDIWTIGHSAHPFDEFVLILNSFKIEIVADVRSLPGSRKFPQFDKENLMNTLPKNKIEYVHILKLGGRRKVKKDSKNTAWRHPAFRGYADYMETDDFKAGIDDLISIAETKRTAVMCAEVVWWRCHRSMIADYLKLKGWNVIHIISSNKSEEHPYTKPAKIIDGMLDYSAGNLFPNNT